MDRLAAGIMIAIAAVVMNGGLVQKARGESIATPPAPIVWVSRSERVLSLIIALEALRATPALLAPAKV